MLLRSFFLLLTTITKGSFAFIVSRGDLPIVNKDIAPDGYSRSATLAGGTFPGPLITGNKASNIKINVINELTDTSMNLETSIHWHGLALKHGNYVDGVSFVTQCPIIPKEAYRYRVFTGNKGGTFWYHSHFKTQYCDGLRGPLVIYDPGDPHGHLYDVDNDQTVITLADWYHYSSKVAPTIPAFNSTLINGKGRYSGGPTNVALAVVNIEHGKRYRFRLVSISCDPSFIFSIDNHTMSVIEVDGNNVQPLLVDSLHIFAGQRYSAVLNANQPVNNYWIRALPDVAGQDYTNLTNLAILRYTGASDGDPPIHPTKNIPTSVLPLRETDLRPLVSQPVPGRPVVGGADININLNITLNSASTVFSVNGVSFQPPTVPVLLQILSGKNLSELLPKGSIYSLEKYKSVELTIPAGANGGPHPVHLHGHAFHVVRSAGSSEYNFDNPVIRDVVSIGSPGDNVTIRFITQNPGPWFFHCHKDWHLDKGFAVVFAEDVPEVPESDPIADPNAWHGLCTAYDNFIKTGPGHT
ncbi:laccase 2 precursor [Lactifluus subvellereus]|nr:laccase 2 precursor [Lactifluus subvellereus]